jgi:agmatinase
VTERSGDPKAQPFQPVSTRLVPRFAGVPTFLRLPVHDDPADVDVLICGAPFDGGTTFRPGARFGPRAIRVASALGRGYHPERGLSVFDRLRCADGGDILCVPMSVQRSLASIEARVAQIAAASAFPFLVGGDHTISLGALRALAAKHGPLGLVHIDAHSDTFGPAWDIDVHHGTVFRHALNEGLLRPADVLQIGIRGPFTAANDLEFAQRAGIRIVMIDEAKGDPLAVAALVRAVSQSGPCYVSFDMDGVDPAYAPGTGTPVPGGLTSFEALQLMRALSGQGLVGADVVEISPDHDVSGITALLAVSVIGEVLAALAQARPAR